MTRRFLSISVFVFVSIAIVDALYPDANAGAEPSPSMEPTAEHTRGMMFFEPCDDCCCGNPGYEEAYDGCEHRCRINKPSPDVTVHVLQPPPTFIYDVTQTARYTEHRDCCGCPYVCGPCCIPQGEVLAPGNIGRRVAISHCGGGGGCGATATRGAGCGGGGSCGGGSGGGGGGGGSHYRRRH